MGAFSLSYHEAVITIICNGKPCVAMYTKVQVITEIPV